MQTLQKQTFDYTNSPLENISNSQILEAKDFEIIKELKNELTEVFKKAQVFRTRTEMEVSVLNDLKFPTVDSKYWQSIREQDVMYQQLILLSYDYRENQIEIAKLKRDLDKEDDELEKELLKVKIDRKLFTAKNQERTAKDRIREIKEWEEIKCRLKPQMNFDDKTVNNHQLISYTKRWIHQYANLKSDTDVASRTNIVGQLKSGLMECKAKGILDKVFNDINPELQKHLIATFGL